MAGGVAGVAPEAPPPVPEAAQPSPRDRPRENRALGLLAFAVVLIALDVYAFLVDHADITSLILICLFSFFIFMMILFFVRLSSQRRAPRYSPTPPTSSGAFCPYCGDPTQADFTFCRKCGKPLPP
jgi:hypothetical protein